MLRRRVLSLLAVILAAVALALPAQGADVLRLYSGQSPLGDVPAEKRGNNVFVSAGEIVKLLGMQASSKNDTLVVSSGKEKLQLVADAAAAWLGVELVPLAASTVQVKGEWLVEMRSALKLFNALLQRSGKNGSLRWGPGGVLPLPAPPPSSPAPSPTPLPAVVPDPPKPVSTVPEGPIINGLRWGIDDGKIRAVIDFEGPGKPEVKQEAGAVKTTFFLGKGGSPDISSPYGEVKVSSINYGNRIALEFASSLPLKEIIPLESPNRLVIDFSRSSSSAALKETKLPKPAAVPTTPAPPSPRTRKGAKIVVIDAGHGGKDPGAVSNGILEKDVNLAISLLIAKKLKKAGYDARLTRDRDVYLTLQKRTELANNWNADVFMSIHANALPPGRHATGMEIYLMALPTDKDAMQLALIENREIAGGNGDTAKAADKKTKMLLNILGNMQQNAKINESTGFAEYLFKYGKAGGIKMRRVAQAPFFVLRGAAMPAVLIETGFLTEKSEARLLNDKKYQDKIAESMTRGIVDYLKNI